MPKKILSIGGGGIKGVFPASFLSHIEDRIEGKVSDYFDLIVGTSTGGIIALGLGLGLSAKDILGFYKQFGPSIFKGNSFMKSFRHWFASKYENHALREALEKTFGEAQLGESYKRLVIPSLDLDTGKVYIHKTAHHQRFSTDYKRKVVDVALSTSAAPTYFPSHILPSGSPLIDGGVWANNPIGLSVTEAIGILKWAPETLKILSVGCTSETVNSAGAPKLAAGKKYWAMKVVELFMQAQSSASLGTASVLTSHDQITRIDPIVSPKRYKLDSYKAIPSLEGLGDSCAREWFPRIEEFFEEKVEPFEPFYKLKNQYHEHPKTI